MDSGYRPTDKQDIENITPHDVPDRNVRLIASGGNQADREFRQRGSKTDECQSDDVLWNSKPLSDSDSPIDRELRPGTETSQSPHHH